MYLIGVLKRTALWGALLIIINSIALKNTEILYYTNIFVIVYIILFLMHVIRCKLIFRRDSIVEICITSIRSDLVAPFKKLALFFDVIARKWIIHDDSAFHNFIDGLQVVTGGLWSMVIFVIIIFDFILIFF